MSGHLLQLLTGHDWFGDGFGDGDDAHDAMRRAWQDPRIRQATFQLMHERNATRKQQYHRTQPWAAEQFGS